MSAATKADGRRAEHALQLTQLAVKVAAEAMFIVAPDGRIVSANETACDRLEYTQDELVGMRISDIDPHYPAAMWPEHFDELRRNGKMAVETQHRTKSGHLIDVEVSIAYFQFEGVEYCGSSIRDITKRREAEHVLRLQRKVLAGIASTAGDQTETLVELCKLVEELVPKSMATVMLVDKEDGALRFAAGPGLNTTVCQAFEPLVPGAAAGSCGSAAFLKHPVIVEDTRTSEHWKDLQHIVADFNLLACWSIPIFDEHHEVLGTFAISHNQPASPTEFHSQILEVASYLSSIAIRRQRFEEQLKIAHNELAHFSRQCMLGEMASSISHELNQPLAAMVNESFVLERLSQSESPTLLVLGERARSIRQQAMRAADIVKGMRTLAKKKVPTRAAVAPEEIVEKALAIMDPEIRIHGVRLQHISAVDRCTLFADAVQIQQVLVNLIRNAIDAMREVARGERELTVTTVRSGGGKLQFQVSDTGPGVAAEDCETVFDAFVTTKSEGMGLGLTICRSIAEAHSGRLVVGQARPQGAVFSLILPLSPPAGASA